MQTSLLGRGIPRNILACPKEQENYSNASKKSLISADPQRLGQWGNARNWRKLSWKWKRCCERQLATYHLIPFSCFKAILVSMCAVVPSPLYLYTYNGWECEEARCKSEWGGQDSSVPSADLFCLSQLGTILLCLSTSLSVCLSSSL